MAHSTSARKRVRQNISARSRNRWRLRAMRESIKHFQDRLAHGTVDETRAALNAAQKLIDRTAQKGVIHRNQAARRIKRMAGHLATMEKAKA